jgi:ubiquinone/menaquinone biosynthesis C-methylase UbiE
MKLNWAERLMVNNPLRVFQQWAEIRWFKKTMPLKQGASVLEVGCGRGAGARLIYKAFQPSMMHCLDLDIQMINSAMGYLSAKELENICLHTGDVTCLPFEDCRMDAVFDFGALHHVPDWRKALREIARVIKPGGVFFMEELYPASYQNIITRHILLHPREDRFRSNDLRNAIKESNLTLKHFVENKALGILGVASKE